MTMVLNTKYNFKGSYVTFMGNRFLRLFPVYIVILFITFGCFAFFYFYKDVVISPFDVWRDNSLSFMTTLSYIFSAIFFYWTGLDYDSRGRSGNRQLLSYYQFL